MTARLAQLRAMKARFLIVREWEAAHRAEAEELARLERETRAGTASHTFAVTVTAPAHMTTEEARRLLDIVLDVGYNEAETEAVSEVFITVQS